MMSNTFLEVISEDSDTMRKRRLKKRDVQIKSKFNFLHVHNGLRRHKMALLIAPTGAGKSTLVRSILVDFEQNNGLLNALVILSEETVEDFKDEIADIGHEFSLGLMAISEREIQRKHGLDRMGMLITEHIAQWKPDLIIYDNLTTSLRYEGRTPREQLEFVSWLEGLSEICGSALFSIMHTGKNVAINQDLITINDLRGTANIALRSDYCYILQCFIIQGRYINLITIEKSRGYNKGGEGFKLKYDTDKRIYTKDKPLPRQALIELMKSRDK